MANIINSDTYLTLDTESADVSPILDLTNTAGNSQLFFSTASPEGVLVGDRGDVCFVDDGVNGSVWVKSTGMANNTLWVQLASGVLGNNWELDGNTGQTDNVDNLLGSTDNVPIRFITNGNNMATMNPDGTFIVDGPVGLAGTNGTVDIGASNTSYALRISGAADTIFTLQNSGADQMYMRTIPGSGFVTAATGNNLYLGVGGTTAGDFVINTSNQVISLRNTFISDVYAGSGSTYNSLTFQGNGTGVQSGAWRLINLIPQTTNNTGGTTTGIRLDMTLVTGGTNLALDLNTAQANTSPITRYANTDGDTNEFIGNGSPETVVTGSRGDIYRRLDGAGQIYQKTTDGVNTGWVQLLTSATNKYFTNVAFVANTPQTITHSLNVTTPKAINIQLIDDATGTVVVGTYTAYTANTVDIELSVGVASCNILIIG